MESPAGSTPAPGPQAMRAAMAAYIHSLHQAYLDAAALVPPGDQARMPLVSAGSFTVAAVGTRVLHVIATSDPLPAAQGQEVALPDSLGDLQWTVRFFDPVIIPSLGLIDESQQPAFEEIRRTLGLHSVLYHLAVPPGSTLTGHHASHAGTGLAHSHLAAVRDFEALRAYHPGREQLIDEMQGAFVAGLPRAHVLLAREVARRSDLFSVEPPSDPDLVRKEVLELTRPARERH